MALPSDYISGTITLTSGSAAFTGVGTGWLAADFQNGDTILDIAGGGNRIAVIASITGEGAGTLTKPWEGPNLVGVAYRMRYEWDSSRVSAQSRAMIEQLGNGTLQSLAAAPGVAGDVVVFDGPNSISVEPRTNFINGVRYDVQVNTLADRAAYNGQSAGFTVLVSDVGDGRSAVYSKASNASGDWTNAAYITGPMSTVPGPAGVNWLGDYNAGTTYVLNDGVTFNGSSFRKLNASAAGTTPSSAIPPVSDANWEVIAARGVNGSITGVTTFWNGRITVDTTAAQARAGLSAIGVGEYGVGSNNILIETDLDTPTSGTRFLRWSSTTLNRPEDFGSAIQIERAPGFISQLGIGAGGVLFSRSLQVGSSALWRASWDSISLPIITQAQAEAGTLTTPSAWSAERVRQAILALAPAGANVRTALSGSANAIVLSSTTALVAGLQVRFRATSANTGATTIAYAGGAAVACRTVSGAVLSAGYIRTDVDTIATYDGTNWILDREIERGSNANGFYTRFADGSQFCGRDTFSVAASATTLTWPVAFASAVYTCGGTPISSFATSLTSVKFSSFTATNAQVILTNAASGSSTISPVAASICFFAQGYWY